MWWYFWYRKKFYAFFSEEIERINNDYYCSEVIEEFRTNELFTTLDKFRSPGYPDDVLVFFFDKSTEEFEGCWVRLEDLGGEAWLYGKILKEPLNKKHSNKRIHVPKTRMTNYTIIPHKTSFFHVFPPQIRSITLKRADLPLGGAKIFLNTLHNKQICTRKQYIQFI